jgi:dihydrofolate reductase
VHIVLTENCTADGVIDLAAGWFDPTDQTDSQLLAVTRAHMAEQDALLLGRNTFEAFRAFWPNQADDATGITDYLNRVQKYVLSRRRRVRRARQKRAPRARSGRGQRVPIGVTLLRYERPR